MKYELSEKTQSDINFLEQLSDQAVLSWPIEYESNRQTLSATADILNLWLGGEKWRKTGHKFLQIGQDGCGSLFCLWFYPELDEEPPVVFFGSEGERAVVANCARDFVKQMTSGKVFFDGSWLEPDEQEKGLLDWALLSSKAEEYLGESCGEPQELSKLAANNHPDISSWIESNVE